MGHLDDLAVQFAALGGPSDEQLCDDTFWWHYSRECLSMLKRQFTGEVLNAAEMGILAAQLNALTHGLDVRRAANMED